jgi:hypothetical protein
MPFTQYKISPTRYLQLQTGCRPYAGKNHHRVKNATVCGFYHEALRAFVDRRPVSWRFTAVWRMTPDQRDGFRVKISRNQT